jgi:hypothetical protein
MAGNTQTAQPSPLVYGDVAVRIFDGDREILKGAYSVTRRPVYERRASRRRSK